MSQPASYAPIHIRFDGRLADQIDDLSFRSQSLKEQSARDNRRSPFHRYHRLLTLDGGVLITYSDLNRGYMCKLLKAASCASLIALTLGPILEMPLLSNVQLGSAALLGFTSWAILTCKTRKTHTVEIRPNCMIIDGKDIFWAEDIGDNWPELVPDEEDPTKMSISGICGTRFIEYMTANRVDERDRTPEILIAHLKEAMEQLWGRREVTFTPAH